MYHANGEFVRTNEVSYAYMRTLTSSRFFPLKPSFFEASITYIEPVFPGPLVLASVAQEIGSLTQCLQDVAKRFAQAIHLSKPWMGQFIDI